VKSLGILFRKRTRDVSGQVARTPVPIDVAALSIEASGFFANNLCDLDCDGFSSVVKADAIRWIRQELPWFMQSSTADCPFRGKVTYGNFWPYAAVLLHFTDCLESRCWQGGGWALAHVFISILIRFGMPLPWM